MKKKLILCLLSIFCSTHFISAQTPGNKSPLTLHPSEAAVSTKDSIGFTPSFIPISKDSLMGYNEAKVIAEIKANNVQEPEYSNHLYYSKRIFVNTKYDLSGKPSPAVLRVDTFVKPNTSPSLGKGYSGASINAAACVNEDFESTGSGFYGSSISGWTIDWAYTNGIGTCQTGTGWMSGASKFQVRTTPVSNPWPEISPTFVPALSTIPASPLGGSQVAQLGDFNTGSPPNGSAYTRTRIRKSFNVTAANQFFTFAFLGAWEASNHGCCTNPSLLVKLYDCNGNLLPCGTFQFEPGTGCINSGASLTMCNLWCYSWKPFNYSKVAYTSKWQTKFFNLSQLIGQCVTIEFINSSCSAGGHVGSVFLDCQCSASAPSIGQQLVGGASQVVASPASQTICLGQQAVVNLSGASTYTWYTKNVIWTQFATGSSQVISPGTGTHIYSVAATPGLCSSASSTTFQIVVNGPPWLGVAINPNNPICLGTTASLVAVGSGPTSFYWFNGSTSPTVVVAPSSTTSYTVLGTSLTSGCSRTYTATVNVVTKPSLTVAVNPIARCQGGQFTLTASGGSAYYWTPGPATVNPWVVNNSTTQSYTVTSSSGVGCTGSTVAQVIVLTNPTVICSPAAVCTGVTNTLTAGGAVNYTWYIGGNSPVTVTTQTVAINPTSATPYTLCGSVPGPTSCVSCTTGVIPMGTIIPLSVPFSVTLCTNGGPCVTLTATSTVPSANFNWQPINQNGSSVNVCPTVNSQYTVFATSTVLGNCPSSGIVSVTYTNANCCPNPPPTLIPLNNISGTFQNSSYFLNSSQPLTGNANFVNSEVWITPGIQLTVPPGTTLNLENTHLFACGQNMWQGIQVMDGGRITTSNTRFSNSMIEDAEVAIELDGINSANVVAGSPAIDISRIIFNKNFIGIKISNSDPALDSLALGINGCVFASRDMTFTSAPNPLNWPSSSNAISSGGLREAISPTTGVAYPYTNINSFNQTNLKLPHNLQSAHIGIDIENIGNPLGYMPTPGVQFGITYQGPMGSDFNLFDGIGNGIDVTDASLTTADNVFQNAQQYYYPPISGFFGGNGIHQEITAIRNARLKLTYLASTSDGNQFWDCYKGVEAVNVFDLGIYKSIFRSTHDRSSLTPFNMLGFTPGDIGVDYLSNRFNFNVIANEFNNVRQGIYFHTPAILQSYDMTGSNAQTGTFAQNLTIFNNYFGAQVSSAVPIPNTEYMSDAIVAETPNIIGWQNNTQGSYITSNKFDRVYRGVQINGMNDHPLFIGGNSILIEDDYVYGAPAIGWGVNVENNLDNMAITNNTLQGRGVSSNSVSLILCENNYGVISPSVGCNIVSDSKYGFEFSGLNPSTIWDENYMCNHFAGIALTNGGVIGQQGGPSGGNANSWNNNCTWAALTNYQTYCDNSSAASSVLYVYSPSTTYDPTIHGFAGTGTAYANGPTIVTTSTNNITDCIVFNPYAAPPSWRTSAYTGIHETEKENNYLVEVYPNPTRGTVVVITNAKGILQVKVRDITGKLVAEESFENTEKGEVNLGGLPSAIYFLDINSEGTNVIHKKIIKMD